ncbi:uncharacterized protein [Venturia canescens]|uniref:uncharacterized protein n=1 Tax=Venturia canescens TaxID=32260 RepID=UPI001C9D0365|nr:uncharacterized protein LOC122414561 [Venturia canescens]
MSASSGYSRLEFLMAIYEEFNNDAKEWPNYEAYIKNLKGEPLSLMIRECGRLVPVYDKNSAFVQFHPINMPEVKIKRICLIGIILNMKKSEHYLSFQAYDGTGTIEVKFKLAFYQRQLKRRALLDRSFDVLPKDVRRYERMMNLTVKEFGGSKNARQRIRQFQRNHSQWWSECSQGMLGKPLCIGSYVFIYGYCNINTKNIRAKVRRNDNFWANDLLPELIFNAYDVQSISEDTFNEAMERGPNTIFLEKRVRSKHTWYTGINFQQKPMTQR